MGAILPNWQGCGEHGISQSFENWATQHMLLFPSAYPSISSSKELEFQSASSWIQKHPVDSGTMSCPQLQKLPALGPRSQLGGSPGLHSCLFPLLAFRIWACCWVPLGLTSTIFTMSKSLFSEIISQVRRDCTYHLQRTCVGFVWVVQIVYIHCKMIVKTMKNINKKIKTTWQEHTHTHTFPQVGNNDGKYLAVIFF